MKLVIAIKIVNMSRGLLIVFVIMILGLMIWNVYLTQQVTNSAENEKDLKLKIDMLEGEIQVMEYDLITARDSLRILNKIVAEEIEDSIIIYDDFEEVPF